MMTHSKVQFGVPNDVLPLLFYLNTYYLWVVLFINMMLASNIISMTYNCIIQQSQIRDTSLIYWELCEEH